MCPLPRASKHRTGLFPAPEGTLTLRDKLQRAAEYSEARLPLLGAVVQELVAQSVATLATGDLGRAEKQPRDSGHKTVTAMAPPATSGPCPPHAPFPRQRMAGEVDLHPGACTGKSSCFPVPTKTPGGLIVWGGSFPG